MGMLETLGYAGGIGLALWFGRKLLRRANGFDAPASPAEPFARADQTLDDGTSKVCRIMPGVDSFRAYVLRKYGGGDAGICGDQSHQSRKSEHNTGRAWDWKVPAEGADKLIAWLSADGWKMARRLGIGIVIHKGRIWSAWIDGEGPMQRAYTGQNAHTAHVHFSFTLDGAMGKLSGYTQNFLV